MLIEHSGRQFSTVRGSDVDRDGMFLELSEAGRGGVVLEVFYSDADGSFHVTGFAGSVPLEVVEKFIAEARRVLPSSPAA